MIGERDRLTLQTMVPFMSIVGSALEFDWPGCSEDLTVNEPDAVHAAARVCIHCSSKGLEVRVPSLEVNQDVAERCIDPSSSMVDDGRHLVALDVEDSFHLQESGFATRHPAPTTSQRGPRRSSTYRYMYRSSAVSAVHEYRLLVTTLAGICSAAIRRSTSLFLKRNVARKSCSPQLSRVGISPVTSVRNFAFLMLVPCLCAVAYTATVCKSRRRCACEYWQPIRRIRDIFRSMSSSEKASMTAIAVHSLEAWRRALAW